MTDTGLRERKKQETRRLLRIVALRQAAERGLDAVTVDDIAAGANVSTRTFFNYFATKEAALVGFEPGSLDLLGGLVVDRPQDEPPLPVLQAVLGELAGMVEPHREVQVLRAQVLLAHPALLPRHVGGFAELERVLVAGLVRRGVSAPELVVACAVAALRTALDTWTEDGETSLPGHLDQAFHQLSSGFAPVAAVPPNRPARRRGRNIS